MCILYNNYVNLFECVFDFHGMEFKFCSQIFHWWDVCCGSCTCSLDHEWGYIPSSCCDVVDERLVICSFPIKGFCNKPIIIVYKFYKLYGELWCRDFWQEVVIWMAYDT